jgi:hypothetical protein
MFDQAESRVRPDPFVEGDILVYTWGFDQTNVEFYQVTRTTDKSVFIRRLADEPVPGSGGGTAMSDYCVPVPNTFRAEGWGERCSELRKARKVSRQDGRPYLRMEFGLAERWDGEPEYRSWYG